MKISTVLAVAAAFSSSTSLAQTERDLDSHEHGSAALNVAIDNSSVIIELDTPWNNLVGFEHAPSTEEQHALVDNSMATLNQPDQMFTFNGASCEATETVVESTLAMEDEHHDDHDDDHKDADGHDDHDDDHDDHDDDHKDADGHDEHDDHDHDDHDGEGETHSEVLVSYAFNCDNIGQLTSIDVNLLEIWSGFEDLDVQLIGPGGQTAVELSPEQTQLDVSAVQ